MKPIRNVRDTAFDILLGSYELVQPLLDAVRAAVAGKDMYDDAYYEKFFSGVKSVLVPEGNERMQRRRHLPMYRDDNPGE